MQCMPNDTSINSTRYSYNHPQRISHWICLNHTKCLLPGPGRPDPWTSPSPRQLRPCIQHTHTETEYCIDAHRLLYCNYTACQKNNATVVVTTICILASVFQTQYTSCPEKRCHWFFCGNFYKYWRIFIIFCAQLRKRMPKSLAQKFITTRSLCCYNTVWKSHTQK